MKRKFFKSAAVILALTMAFSGIPASAYALETGKNAVEASAASDVTVPVEPTTAIYPTDSVEPTTTVYPTDPIEPTIPVYPTQPVEPTEPVIVNYPEITGFSNTAKGTKISWSKYNSAVKYRVYVRKGTSWSRIGETTGASFTHNSLKNNTTYVYTVRALDKKNNFVSDFNRDGYSNVFIAPPTISSIENVDGGVKIKWSKNSYVPNYRVYRKTKNTSWTRIGSTKNGSFTDTTATSGASYTYTIRALDKKDNFISYFNGGKGITYVKAPIITKIENTATGSKITWSKSSGAAKYRVYRLENNSWKRLTTTASTSYTHGKLTNGKKYTYTVRCLDKKGRFVSGYSKAGKTNLFLAPPAISSISKVKNGNLISWKKVSGADGYRLYRKSYGSSWSRIVSTTDNSFVDTTAKKDTVVAYTLRCLDKKGNLISSYVDKTKYYRNGKLANGTVTVNGKKLNFDKGVLRTGMQTINGNKYYYNASGVLQKNGIVGSDKSGWYYADKNGKIDFSYSNGITQNGKDWNVMSGKATRVKTKSDKTLFRALKVVAKVTNKSMSKSQKLKACFNYTKNAYKELNPRIPHYHGSDWPIIYANDMFVDGAGNCFSYGAAFAYMAKAIGYKNVYCCNSGGHGWAEVDGLVYDPEWSRHHARDYYALSYNTKLDQNYKAAIAAGYSWMHVKI